MELFSDGNSSGVTTKQDNSLAHLFKNISYNFRSYPENLFQNNTNVTTFESCFDGSSYAPIPEKLFRGMSAAVNFSKCFQQCIVLRSIPENLFADCISAKNFANCFNYCRNLSSIPENLFKYNTEATSFSTCFQDCSSIASIPSNLFASNTKATDFYCCFNSCSSLADFDIHIGSPLVSRCSDFVTKNAEATRTVHVPSGSTTQTAFNNVASNLGLTIIGE
jgi:hypothetical protein